MPTVTLNIPDTSFVSSVLPDNNLSFSPLLYTGTDSTFQDCISFLQIALPSLPVTAVDSAILQLTVIAKSGESPSPVVVNRVASPFSTETVTYNTRPSFAATPSQLNITASDLYTNIQINITSLVNSWLDGSLTNNGIALTNSDGTTVVEFAANDIAYEPYFPQLILTYSSTPVEPDSAIYFSYAQLAHLIEQLIVLYPTNTVTVFTKGFSPSSVTGTPYQLYSSSEGTYGAIFVLTDNGQQEAIPINAIAAIYTGDATVYNPSITYLPTPTFPAGCDTNLITAVHDYLPISTEVQIYIGSIVQASGTIYKNEYGILVLSDAAGNTPVFVPITNITMILPLNGTAPTPSLSRKKKSQKVARPRITITKKFD